jgi:hypothetical protein
VLCSVFLNSLKNHSAETAQTTLSAVNALCKSPANMQAFANDGLLDIVAGLVRANPNNVIIHLFACQGQPYQLMC